MVSQKVDRPLIQDLNWSWHILGAWEDSKENDGIGFFCDLSEAFDCVIDDNGKLDIKCQHGPKECYGNKLHACAIDKLQHTTALLYNVCLMNSTSSVGSDDESADRCGKSMNIDSEPIKECAKGTRGMELLQYYGEESRKAHFSYVPYILINGKVFEGDDFKEHVCASLTKPPPTCK